MIRSPGARRNPGRSSRITRRVAALHPGYGMHIFRLKSAETHEVRIEKIGDSTVLVLPDELLAKMNLKPGQWVELTELPGDDFRLTDCTADFNKAMTTVDKAMVDYQDALKKLADS